MALEKISLIAVCLTLARTAEWDYDENGIHGPNNWGGFCQTGTSQSPINITLEDAVTDVSLGTFSFINYNKINKYAVLKNNGHTIQADMMDDTVKLSGGGLVNNTYTLAQMHLHWGTSSTTGSEHFINGEQAPLEIHFVHYNDVHGDLGSAASEPNGLAVLGFLFEIQQNDNPNLNFFVNSITNVANKDDRYMGDIGGEPAVETIFRGVDLTRFIRYSGSLTTPTCDESVQWTVFTGKIPISESQMAKIRATYMDSGSTPIGKNFRPLQPLNNRVVKITYSLHWDYNLFSSHGPRNWGGLCQAGTRQSPIDIRLPNAKVVTDMEAFTFTNYDQTMKYGDLLNNGHTVQVNMADDTLKMSGGSLGGTYTLAQFHFHWGEESRSGSEHYMNGSPAPMEVHFVHYNDAHGDLLSALTKPNGLAVLGFMFEVQPNDNANLTFLLDRIPNVKFKGESFSSALGNEPEVKNLFGNVDLKKFIRYSGSLTTPGCYESVQWTVFTDRIPISESQLNKIRTTYEDASKTDHPIAKNYRPVQPLNSREVLISFDPNVSAASVVAQNISLFLVLLLLKFLF